MTSPRLSALTAYARTRWLARKLRSKESIEQYQGRATERLIADVRSTVMFYRDKGPRFQDMPIIDKATQQSHFAAFNKFGVTLDDVVEAIEAGNETLRGLDVGHSTGTSGNRGRFVISPEERFIWLGTIVAKAIPDALVRRRRVALALPGFSSLYRSAPEGSRVNLAFFDLAEGVAAWRDAFIAFAPDTIVAPPKILRVLAEDGALRRVEAFSGAEVLDPLDREVIEAATGTPVREIYMATEGLFGVGCRYGTLHLAEDVVRYEWEPAPGGRLVAPIVTDLVRRVQPTIRYRMNDLLELSTERCPCGSPYQAVARVHGRMDDLFEFGRGGQRIIATPDILRNAVVDADPAISDFRIVQKRDGRVVVTLSETLPQQVHDAAREALRRTLLRLGVEPVVESARGINLELDRKLRRVERERN